MIRALSIIVLMMLTAPAMLHAQAPTPAAAPGAPASEPQNAAVPDTALEPQGFTYNPEGRRDPFVSLLRRGADLTRTTSGSRPPGLPGLATSEVTLSGIMASRGSYVAMLQGIDKRTYIVRSGDKLLDGTIRAITADTMVILQQVKDPLALETQREVRKTLRQTEEAN